MHDISQLTPGDAAWLQRLAHSLTRDPHLAEDAAQETWLAALRRPAGSPAHRGWLRSVLRNALHQSHRRLSLSPSPTFFRVHQLVNNGSEVEGC